LGSTYFNHTQSSFIFSFERILFKIIFKIPSDGVVDSYPEIKVLLDLNRKKHRPDLARVSETDIAFDTPIYIVKHVRKKSLNEWEHLV
jgi:hypothetical protein